MDFNFKINFGIRTTDWYWLFLTERLSLQVHPRNLLIKNCGHKVKNRLSYTLVSSSMSNPKTYKICHKFSGFVAPTLELLNNKNNSIAYIYEYFIFLG